METRVTYTAQYQPATGNTLSCDLVVNPDNTLRGWIVNVDEHGQPQSAAYFNDAFVSIL